MQSSFARLIVISFLFLTASFAQNFTGRISGTVTDTSGSVIPGVKVTITNQATNVVTNVVTDPNGFYVATSLLVGTYSVSAESTGFRRAEKVGYDLMDNGRITADFKLDVGAVTESVVVTEVLGETVNTVSGELSRTIDSEQVADLALNGRNYLQLVSLIPGVALLDEDQMATTTSLSVTTWAANGGRPGTSHLMVDGGMNLDSGSNGSQVNNVGVDFVREVNVKSSAFSAEYGRNSGAAVNAITKSGGSQFHGGLIYTLRNDALDAKDYFAPTKPVLRFADFGWNVGGPIYGGPIKKGKLFFFAGQEWKRIRRFTSPTRRTMPTLAEINGDFSDRTNAIRYPGQTLAVPNKDLRSLMTPDGKAVMAVYGAMIPKAALYTNTPTANNATFQVLNPFNWRQDIARVDYRVSDSNNLYFRWIHDNYDLVDPFGTFNGSQLPNTPTARNRPGYGPQIGNLWTINRHWINEAKLNTSWNGQRTPLQGTDWKRSTYGFQFPLLFGGNGLYSDSIPNVTVNGFASYNGAAFVYLMSPTTDITVSDNITYLHGAHTFKAGFMAIRNRKDQNGRALYAGSIAFNTSPNTNSTGYALADAALGNFSTYSEANRDAIGFFRFTQYEGFFQDSWRVNKKLNIEVGVRLSHFIPTYTTGNNIANFDPSRYNTARAVSLTTAGFLVPGTTGDPYNGLVRAGDGIPASELPRVINDPKLLDVVPTGAPRGLYPSYNLMMPRFSFAYSPFGNSKTAIRGGIGTYHDRVQGNLVFSQSLIPPFSSSVAYESGSLNNPSGGTQAARGVMGGISSIDPNLKVPSVINWNFGIQRSLWQGIFLDISYTGNVGHHLLRKPDINFPTFDQIVANNQIPSAQRPVTNYLRPYKGFSNINLYLSDANSNYNSLQTYVTRRKGNLITTVSYTWAHTLADASGDSDNPDSGLGYQNRHYFYGSPSFDRRHVFVVTYTYRIPLFRRSHGFVGGALGRWELSGITRAQSGPRLTPVGSSTGVTRRADFLGGDINLDSSEKGPNHWFNTTAFRTAPTTAIGTGSVGMIGGPGLYVWDLSVRKEFRITEQWKLRIEAQSFNFMNHPNFRGLDVTTSNAAFGTVSGAGPARNIQFAARFNF